MKKILSVLFAAIMVFSAVSCLSAGAVSGSTADEVTDVTDNTLEPEEDNDSIFSGEYELGAVVVGLKKDSPSVEVLLADFEITESRLIMELSDQTTCYYVKFAEKTEEIVWEAIAVLNESPYVKYAEPNYFAYIDPIEISTTEVPKETVSDTQPTATSSENLKSSTSDTAKTTTPATSDTAATPNSNGTVQTGQNNLMVVLTLLLIISAAAAVFMKFRYRN